MFPDGASLPDGTSLSAMSDPVDVVDVPEHSIMVRASLSHSISKTKGTCAAVKRGSPHHMQPARLVARPDVAEGDGNAVRNGPGQWHEVPCYRVRFRADIEPVYNEG